MAPSKKKLVQTAVTAKNETEVKKKRGTNTRKNVQQKPKSKTPTLLRIKLPKSNPESGLPVSNEKATGTKKTKLLAHDIKIQLANEVLKTILTNKKSVTSGNNLCVEAPTVNVTQSQTKNKANKVQTVLQPRRRGRKKKSVELKPDANPEVIPPSNAGSEELFETVPANVKITKKPGRKAVKNVVAKETTTPKVKKPRVKKQKGIKPPLKKSNRLQIKNINNPTKSQIINKIALEIENNICKTDEKQSVKLPSQNNEQSDHSRRTSMSSNCLSWTKDISSSSTNTCLTVKSDDFFRIDNKIPIIELKKVDNKTSVSSSSSDSDSTSSSSSVTNSVADTPSETKSMPVFNGRSPNLSMSSFSRVASDSSPQQQQNKYTDEISRVDSSPQQQQNKYTDEMDTFEKALKALDKVKLMMNSFNLEILNWIGYPDESEKMNPKMKSRLKIIDQLKPENDIVRLCQQFEEKINKKQNVEPTNDECMTKDSLVQLDTCSTTYTDKHCDLTSHGEEDNSKNDSPTQFVDDVDYPDKQDYRDESIRDKIAHQGYPDEDDDVISLFAEGSISGGESYRHSSIVQCNAPVQCNQETVSNEEYIPLPVSSHLAQVSYKPSKIHTNFHQDNLPDDNQHNGIFKLPNVIQKTLTHPVNKNIEELKRNLITENNQSNRPLLMASVFGQKRVKSVVFKDVCFFNLISMCKRENCGFPHVKFDVHAVQNKLLRLREDVFIREYMTIRNWAVLRRLYGMYYVEECYRRELTNILIEMAIDFAKHTNKTTAEDVALSVVVLETALLHLNKVDLQTCKDLLNYNMAHGVLLCDMFMHTIAVTQNFSRFKIVFINLTNFIVEQGKTFSKDVAENIVERLSILPIEEPVAKALITILKNTDSSVLQNPRLSQFEVQLLKLDSDLYKELQLLKVQVMPPTNMSSLMPHSSMEDENMGHERYTTEATSQDVSINHITEDVNPTPVTPLIFTVTNNYANASSSSSDDTNYRQPQNERFSYRDKFNSNGFDHWAGKGPRMLRGVKRRFDQRNIKFGGQIPKYPRRI